MKQTTRSFAFKLQLLSKFLTVVGPIFALLSGPAAFAENIQFTSPKAGQSVTAVTQACVTLKLPETSAVTIEIAADRHNDSTLLKSGTSANGIYCASLNSFFFDDGNYILKATALDAQNNSFVTQVGIKIENGINLGAATHFAGEDAQTDDINVLVPLLKKANMKSVHFSFMLSWVTESEDGTPTGISYIGNNVIKDIRIGLQNGISPVITLMSSPKIVAVDPNDALQLQAATEARADFAKRAAYLAKVLGEQVTMYEIWDEWNGSFGLPGSYKTYPANDVVPYLDLLCKNYEALTSVNPNMVVIAAASIDIANSRKWVENFFNQGGLKCMTAYSIHPYQGQRYQATGEKTMQTLDALRNDILALPSVAGANIPFMITEDGISADCLPHTTCYQHHYTVAQQAVYYHGILKAIKARPYLKLYEAYKMIDGNSPSKVTDQEQNFGICSSNGIWGHYIYTPKVDPETGLSAYDAFVYFRTAPTILSTIRMDDNHIAITFSQTMGDGVMTAANYTLNGTHPDSVELIAKNIYQLTWTNGGLLAIGDISVSVTSVMDADGNLIR